ncbi:MAG: FAD-dependent oxidoreductase [Verrucomicrobia bacterium]|nr:FAD-dependent oxidoreductase [Verrucomicrobiota bacterium]
MSFTLTIDGRPVQATEGESLLQVARRLGLDIPTLCYLEKCGPLNTCLVCLVKTDGRMVPSCGTPARPGMIVESETEEVHAARRTALELLFSDHVGDCLSPCHRLCPLGLNIPVMLRQIEAQQTQAAILTVRQALPLAGVLGRLCHHPCEQGCRRGNWDGPAAIRDLERFVTDRDREQPQPSLPPQQPPSGRSLVIVGAGPTGLAAAHALARAGHAVTLLDRHAQLGGTLRGVPESDLPAVVLEAELALLPRLGIALQPGVELGRHVTLPELAERFDAVLLTVGEVAPADAPTLGVPLAGANLKTDPNTCQTPVPKTFAAGAAVKPVKQLVRAMSEGRAAAECVDRSLRGQPVCRPEKPFSSVMGRLDPAELRQFLLATSSASRVSPCDRCAGFSPPEATCEAARCLHCDCRSSGNCVLQHYAQVYGADANRFRADRRPFEQHLQPGGVIFEPGKCIRCGICVKLTELAAEPLGLTFVGRGFDVQLAAPMNRAIAEGLQKVAEECVQQCPTGALAFADPSASRA